MNTYYIVELFDMLLYEIINLTVKRLVAIIVSLGH